MQILWRLVLAHLLADFTFQTDFIAKWKRESIFGGLIHSFVFFACASVLCFSQLGRPWAAFGIALPANGWVALALLSFCHFLEDEWRVRTIRKFRSADSFFFFLLDQFIHLALIYFFFPPGRIARPETWVMFGMLFVLATHFASIFVYFIEKTVSGSSRLDTRERYFSMAERLAICIALLLPGFWALSFAAAWLPRMFISRSHPEYDTSFLNHISGNLLAIILGVAARTIYYG